MGTAQRHLVITVHGIRTFGEWQRRLETLLTAHDNERRISVHSVDYGYFSVVAFFLPFVRWFATRRLQALLLESIKAEPWGRIDIVAHSFGTHLVGWALQSLTPEQRSKFRINTLIFAGSVLHPQFPWSHLLNNSTGCVERVVNDCGTEDGILIMSHVLVPLASMAGRVGFRGTMNEHFRNRYFAFGHSGYFMTEGRPNGFMEQCWLPLLTTDTPATSHDERKTGEVAGLVAFLINNAEPFKLVFYALLGYAAYLPVHHLELEREQARQAELVVRLAESAFARNLEMEDPGVAALLARQAYVYNERFGTNKAVIVDRALRKVLGAPFFSRQLFEQKGDLGVTDISSNGLWLAVAGEQGKTWLWTLDDLRRPPVELSHSLGTIRALAFRADSKQLLAMTDAAEALIWDIPPRGRSPRQKTALPGAAGMIVAAASHDNEWVAAGFADGQTRVWRLQQPDVAPVELCCHGAAVTALAFHPLLNLIATGSSDVRLWEWTDPAPARLIFNEPTSTVSTLAWNPDSRRLAVGTKGSIGREAAVLIGDIFKKPPGLTKIGEHIGRIASLQFTPDGAVLVSAGGADRTVQFLRLGKSSAELIARLRRHQNPIGAAVVDPKGRYLVSLDVSDASASPSTVLLWSLASAPAAPQLRDEHKGVVFVRFAPRGAVLASVGSLDKTLILYDVDSGRTLQRIKHGEAIPESIAFAADGKTVATGSRSQPAADEDEFKVRVFAFAGNAADPVRTFADHRSAVKALGFSADGRWLASSGFADRSILIRDLKQPQSKPAFIDTGDNQVLSLVFHPVSAKLAWAGTDKAIYVKAVNAVKDPAWILSGHTAPVLALAFSPDGSRIASGSIDKTIRIWNADKTTDKPLEWLQPSAVTDVSFAPDGRMLASGGEDAKVRLWEIESVSNEFQQLDGSGGDRTTVSFSADGRYIASGGTNGKVLIWPSAANLAEQACKLAARNLTKSEWTKLVGGPLECTCPEGRPCPAEDNRH